MNIKMYFYREINQTILCLLVAAAVGAPNESFAADADIVSKTPRTVQLGDGTIFNSRNSPGVLDYCGSKCKSHGLWTPSKEDIDQFHADFKIFLSDLDGTAPKFIIENYPDYREQYYGYIGEKRQRHIFVNAFCKDYWESHPDWRTKFVAVMDGGSCFFRVEYDVERHSFANFYINGDA